MLETKHLELWTSRLEYSVNIEKSIEVAIKDLSDKVIFSTINKTTKIIDDDNLLPSGLKFWIKKSTDHTCIAKGYFIQYVIKHIPVEIEEYYINFGGDIYSTVNSHRVKLAYNNFYVSTDFYESIFTSTNRERPGHIKNPKYDVFVKLGSNPITADFLATKGLAGQAPWSVKGTGSIDPIFAYGDHLAFDFDGKLVGKTYIASPFFNDTDITIRDAMIQAFKDYVRPDLLNPNIEGDLNKDWKLAKKIRKDNLDAIDDCIYLVFPKNTTDLGTLFEVGYALSKSKIVIRYDYEQNIYEIVFANFDYILDKLPITLNLNTLGSGVVMGWFYDQPKKVKYYLGESQDNIMLMMNPKEDNPSQLYPCYLPEVLGDKVYSLTTMTSGS